jgi:hypothetical protein
MVFEKLGYPEGVTGSHWVKVWNFVDFMVEVEDWKLRRDIERDLSRKGGERDKGKKSVSEGIWINVVIKSLCINHVHSMILLSLLNFCYISTAFNFFRLIFNFKKTLILKLKTLVIVNAKLNLNIILPRTPTLKFCLTCKRVNITYN